MHASRNEYFSHTLACEQNILKMFGQGKSEDENTNILDTFNTKKRLFRTKKGPYDHDHIWTSHLLGDQMPRLWHQEYSVGATHIFGKVAYRLTYKIVIIGYDKKIEGCQAHPWG